VGESRVSVKRETKKTQGERKEISCVFNKRSRDNRSFNDAARRHQKNRNQSQNYPIGGARKQTKALNQGMQKVTIYEIDEDALFMEVQLRRHKNLVYKRRWVKRGSRSESVFLPPCQDRTIIEREDLRD